MLGTRQRDHCDANDALHNIMMQCHEDSDYDFRLYCRRDSFQGDASRRAC